MLLVAWVPAAEAKEKDLVGHFDQFIIGVDGKEIKVPGNPVLVVVKNGRQTVAFFPLERKAEVKTNSEREITPLNNVTSVANDTVLRNNNASNATLITAVNVSAVKEENQIVPSQEVFVEEGKAENDTQALPCDCMAGNTNATSFGFVPGNATQENGTIIASLTPADNGTIQEKQIGSSQVNNQTFHAEISEISLADPYVGTVPQWQWQPQGQAFMPPRFNPHHFGDIVIDPWGNVAVVRRSPPGAVYWGEVAVYPWLWGKKVAAIGSRNPTTFYQGFASPY
jgi:hypothetical protein